MTDDVKLPPDATKSDADKVAALLKRAEEAEKQLAASQARERETAKKLADALAQRDAALAAAEKRREADSKRDVPPAPAPDPKGETKKRERNWW